MAAEQEVVAGRHEVALIGNPAPFDVEFTSWEIGVDLHIVSCKLSCEKVSPAPALTVKLSHPLVDIQGRWIPATQATPGLLPEWACQTESHMTRDAPVVSFYNLNNRNRLTLALSDAMNPVVLQAGVYEEEAALHCSFHLFKRDVPPAREYSFQLLIDTRDIPYYESLNNVSQWWADEAGYAPMRVPECARVPFYSTWYSFHQSLDVDKVVEQCQLARDLGCRAVIVDDGWQTTDQGRGYAFTGDWQPERIGDMWRFVDAVHETGMKFLLWYALPFAGDQSEIKARFAEKTLNYIDHCRCAVLDPRYAEVREYFVDTLAEAMTAWGLDGFKLDFVDWFDTTKAPDPTSAMDHADVVKATQTLLGDIRNRLTAINPDVMLEFRQPYIGPAMRQFANMFRAVDCPNDSYTNRVNTLDLRLICGQTAVHSDMFMWHPDDPPESAALQLLNVLFTVPQVSVLLHRQPPAHLEMLRFWLEFWQTHRDVLLEGTLAPLYPQSGYPTVMASNADKCVIASYSPQIVDLPVPARRACFIVNATRRCEVVVRVPEPATTRDISIFDCRGQKQAVEEIQLDPGIEVLPIPPAGVASLIQP